MGGELADRWGRKATIVIGNGILTVTTFTTFLARDLISAIASFGLWNFGLQFSTPPLTALIAESVPRNRRATALSTYRVLPPLMLALAPPIGGSLIPISWHLVFIVGGILCLTGTMLRFLYLRETLAQEAAHGKLGLLDKLRSVSMSTAFLLILLAYSLDSIGREMVTPYFPIFANAILAIDLPLLGVMLGLPPIMLSIVSTFAGRLADKYGIKNMMCASLLVESLFIIAFVHSPSLAFAFLFFAIWRASDFLDLALPGALIANISSQRERGLRMGLFASATAMAGIPGPIVGGLLYSVAPRSIFYADVVVCLLMIALILSLKKT